MNRVFIIFIVSILVISISLPSAADWKPHVVQQVNGRGKRIKLKAEIQIVTEQMNEVTGVPYMVYLPDKDQVLMTFAYRSPHVAALLSSSDHGATWSKMWFMRTDAAGNPALGFQTGLSYLGNGKVISGTGYISEDYGATWPGYRPVPTCWPGKAFYGWDPIYVDRDPATGKLNQLIVSDWRQVDPAHEYTSNASIFFSTDEGQTWSPTQEVPEWTDVNEVAFIRAKNGDLIAGCRTDNPARFKQDIDHYCGLAVSISKDNGKTWSKLNRLYEWGRHHPSMVVMPNGDIVMSYVVRLGYNHTMDDYPQFGVEAIVSRDNGQTWDLDHKYILASWKGNRTGPNEWWASSQATTTVLLPDGSLLTAYGTGFRGVPRASDGEPSPRDVGLVHWKLNNKGLNKEHMLSDAVWNSDQRNMFQLTPIDFSKFKFVESKKHLVARDFEATITASKTDKDPSVLVLNDYMTRATLTFRSMPCWLDVKWKEPQTISEIHILAGEPAQIKLPSGECAPLEYTLQYFTNGNWVNLVPPVKQEITDKSERDFDKGLVFTHKFPLVKTTAVRLRITNSSDTGKRISSPDKVIVQQEDRATTIRGFAVYSQGTPIDNL
jgi:hypothetical protein